MTAAKAEDNFATLLKSITAPTFIIAHNVKFDKSNFIKLQQQCKEIVPHAVHFMEFQHLVQQKGKLQDLYNSLHKATDIIHAHRAGGDVLAMLEILLSKFNNMDNILDKIELLHETPVKKRVQGKKVEQRKKQKTK